MPVAKERNLAWSRFDVGKPAARFLLAAAAGHHLGEAADVPGQGVQVGTVALDVDELGRYCAPHRRSASRGASDLPRLHYLEPVTNQVTTAPESGRRSATR